MRSSCIATAVPAVGTVVHGVSQLAERRQPPSDSPQRVVRMATHDDVVSRLKQQHREREAQRIAMLKVNERGLGMKLTRVEQAFDGSKLVFYFTADGRVDFRELVKELAAEFKTRIEMRQIGVRDEAKMIGGYGTCGRPLCCTTFLTSFEPVSIKMAKQQDLSLNPSKLSGLCGRLKCCLRYELPNAKGVVHGGCGERRRLRQSERLWLRRLRRRRLRQRRLRQLWSRTPKPRIAITAGDPAGIGPEIAAAAAADPRVLAVCEPVVYAAPDPQRFPPGVLSGEAGRAAYDTIVRAVDDARQGRVGGIATAPGEQGSVPAGWSAVERPYGSARRTSPARRMWR